MEHLSSGKATLFDSGVSLLLEKKNMNRLYKLHLLTIGLLILGASVATAQTKADTDTITARFRTVVLSSVTADAKITAYLDSLQPNGSWNDVDYADKSLVNWLPLTHMNRVQSICVAYNTPKSIYYHSPSVKAKVYLAFDYWNKRNPISSNWYQNDIAWPTVYGKSLLTMKTGDSFGFSKDTLYVLADSGLNYYNASVAIYSPTISESILGSNQTLNLQVSIYKACIKDSTDELRRNFDTAFASIMVFPGTGLGMKVDNSYYQHGSQLYNWGYGTAFLGGVSFFAYYTRNTGFATSTSNIKMLIDYVLDGQQWFQQKNFADFDACGRSISRSGSLAVSSIRSNCLIYLINLNTGYRTTELNNYYKFANGGNVTFQSPGNKQFFKVDFMAHHGTNFYLSVKTPSKRTIGTESLNGENLKAKYLPWGSTNIMINGDEYQNAIPVWDWTRIPGTTAANDPNANFTKLPANKYTPTNSYAGGVSNGIYGLSADAFTWDSVSGRKSYFFTPAGMYCMGAGITSNKKGRYIVTSVNQCMSSGTITIDSAGTQVAFSGQKSNYSNVSWVHHNNVGYIFPNYGPITISNQVQTGSWYSINSAQSTATVSNTIFSLWVNHDTMPKAGTYEYVVVPFKSVSQFSTWAATCPLKKVKNTTSVQAFLDDSAKVYAVAFYAAGTILLDSATKFAIRSSNPILLLIQKQANGYGISVADPTQLLSSVVLTTSILLTGPNATINVDSTVLNIALPKGDTAGKTITNNYILTNPLPVHFVDIKSNVENNAVVVNWEVSNEEGIAKYEVEKSTDGKNFALFQSVLSLNNSLGKYSVLDNNIVPTSYYRIKAFGLNGEITYSSVSQIRSEGLGLASCKLFPNPLTGHTIHLSMNNLPSSKYSISLTNALGQTIFEQTMTHSGVNRNYTFEIGDKIAKGIYQVVIKDLVSKNSISQTLVRE